MGKFQDLTEMVFGELTVIKRAPDYILPCGKPQIMWECKCSCGRLFTTRALQLKNGESQSCGHLQKEIVSKLMHERMKKFNEYDLSGDYGIGYTSNGEEFYFDLEDYDKIKDYCWCKNPDGYIQSGHKLMHRIVMEVSDDNWKSIQVDHIHDKESRHDNRKSNLRIANFSTNGMNRDLRSNNTSGCTGVSFDKRRNKWRARIKINKKEIGLGYYDEKEDAIKARKDAENKYFGEWSYDNSQAINIEKGA